MKIFSACKTLMKLKQKKFHHWGFPWLYKNDSSLATMVCELHSIQNNLHNMFVSIFCRGEKQIADINWFKWNVTMIQLLIFGFAFDHPVNGIKFLIILTGAAYLLWNSLNFFSYFCHVNIENKRHRKVDLVLYNGLRLLCYYYLQKS